MSRFMTVGGSTIRATTASDYQVCCFISCIGGRSTMDHASPKRRSILRPGTAADSKTLRALLSSRSRNVFPAVYELFYLISF